MQLSENISVEPSPDPDRELVAAVLRKDRKATAEFVSRMADWVYPFVLRRLVPHTEMTEDLVQEILLAGWQSLPQYRGEAGLRAWIMGVARHKVEDYYRKRIREAEVPPEDEAEPVITAAIDEHLDVEAQQRQIHDTLAKLPEPYSIVLLWRYRDEKTIREIAEAAGKTEKAVERLLARARAQFKKRWER
jgi:RNA polymerase sigma-70 factor, ECF subfamily